MGYADLWGLFHSGPFVAQNLDPTHIVNPHTTSCMSVLHDAAASIYIYFLEFR